MADNVEISMVLPASPAQVWQAFVDSELRSQWEACSYTIEPRQGGRYRWEIPGHGGEGVIEAFEPEKLLVQYDASGTHGESRQSFRFSEYTPGNTRLELVHEGLPGPDHVSSVTLGWQQALADLVVWLRYGVCADRFGRAMQHLGFYPLEQPEGLVINQLEPEGVATVAGLQVGDLLLAVDGVPIFSRPELWVCMRAAKPGDRLALEYVRDGALLQTELVFPAG